MTTKRASEDALDLLHALVAQHLSAEITAAASRTACSECGQKPGIPPALLAQAIKFLSENGIDAPASSAGDRFEGLRRQLPQFDDEDAPSNVVHLPAR